MGLLDSIRRWVDGDSGADPLQKTEEQSQVRRVWEEFLVKIAREVEAIMQKEMFTPPGGPTYIPREYIVFLSSDDDKEWQGEKRKGLLQGLHHVLLERARELSGKTKLAAKSFAVELRVDGTLNKGEFRIQPVWEESDDSPKTDVQPRKNSQVAETYLPGVTPQYPQPQYQQPQQPEKHVSHRDLATVPDQKLQEDYTESIQTEPAIPVEDEVDETVVKPRSKVLYSIEIWRNGVRQVVLPVSKPEVTIGRGSRTVSVDVPIKGDPEISRVHVTIFRDDSGNYWLTPKGRNSTILNGKELAPDQSVLVKPDEKIQVCSYVLRIQP